MGRVISYHCCLWASLISMTASFFQAPQDIYITFIVLLAGLIPIFFWGYNKYFKDGDAIIEDYDTSYLKRVEEWQKTDHPDYHPRDPESSYFDCCTSKSASIDDS